MAFNENVAKRLRTIFSERDGVVEKKMFGGIAFMLHGNMCCGTAGDAIMARVGPDQYQEALARPHTREMDFTGRPMKGFIYVDPEGIKTDKDLRSWISICEKFVLTLPPKKQK